VLIFVWVCSSQLGWYRNGSVAVTADMLMCNASVLMCWGLLNHISQPHEHAWALGNFDDDLSTRENASLGPVLKQSGPQKERFVRFVVLQQHTG
jgi:hypothetical protein